MESIGVLTSGGDAPGMNPCIRAVVRTALSKDLRVIGIREGYTGLVQGDMRRLQARDVGGILQGGGTMLGTARCPEFKTKKGQREAIRNLHEANIDTLVVIGGDGSMRGARVLAEEGIPVVGLPGSIDNDMWGTNMSIGTDTAMNTIQDAIDKLKDTASSHRRAFIIETMGRNCGYLAIMAGLVGGAEMVLIPEQEVTVEEVAESVEASYKRGKTHAIIIVAEGASVRATELSDKLNELDVGFKTRVTILGHIQRGGRPSAFDRLLATRLGVAAVEHILEGSSDIMLGLEGRDIVPVPLEEVVSKNRPADLHYYEMCRMLAY
ncbi:MAG: 6-phosphofructokinase [Chloroflexi bacterium]|nr:MAG: 6-phosphofructokinase [Chloroflexota bacterium]MBL1195199.1 6-phosphofructokinase [Chloroflexota bacterium]NOH12484.1 6-phosphofructokinase [Chloroflexota bacterium]